MRFRTLLLPLNDEHCLTRISSTLDRMDPQSRLWTVLSIDPEEQARVWELFADSPISAEHFVPDGMDALNPVIHHGKNTLPVSKFFQKRFCRADDDSGDIWGYNHQSLAWLTGPGYFVAHAPDAEAKDVPSSYLIDYTRKPARKPADWPELASNDAGVGRLVYGGMKDYMRKISEHVSIGRAYRHDRPMDSWFILCREDEASG